MPCGLDEQPAGMGIPGLRDPSQGPGGPRGMLAGHQAKIGRDGATGEPVPVTELNCESEPGQGVDAAQAAQPVGHGRELGIGC